MGIRNITDWLIPTLEKEADDYQNKIDAREKACIPESGKLTNEKDTQHYLEILDKRISNEEDRKKSFDSKLQTILGLIPVVMTLFHIAFSRTNENHGILFWYIILSYLYIQFGIGLFYSIKGLYLRNYKNTHTIIPSDVDENYNVFLLRLIDEKTKCLIRNMEQNNIKGTYLNLANICLRNVVVGIIIMSFVSLFRNMLCKIISKLICYF